MKRSVSNVGWLYRTPITKEAGITRQQANGSSATGNGHHGWSHIPFRCYQLQGTAAVFNLKASLMGRQLQGGVYLLAAPKVQASSDSLPSSAYMVLENEDKFPAPDHLTFSVVQAPWHREGTPENRNHNKVSIRISNKGKSELVISNLQLSDASAWKISLLGEEEYNAAKALPLTLKSGASVTLTLAFIAKNQSNRVTILQGSLRISSNDDKSPEKEVQLHGLWQRAGEGDNEPDAQEIISAFGFKTKTGYNQTDGSNDGTSVIPGSDEVLSPFFVRADASRPVEVIQMAAYHGCCAQSESFRWYAKGSSSTNTLFKHDALDGQSLLPMKSGSSSALARGSFNPTEAFGFSAGSAYSDRTQNHKDKIGMRIWKAVDANGKVIPNAYIIGSDYLGTESTNYDYQDNVYFVRNIRPEEGTANFSELTASPSAITFAPTQVGGNTNLTVRLSNQGKLYANGSSDPAVQIQEVKVVGPNRDAFAAAVPGSPTLAVQSSTDLTVTFKPTRPGLKNAALLVSYTNNATPLRIPLYGIADNGNATITVLRRIKGAADVPVSIAGNVWEADKSYRQGSIKLDKQVVTTPVAATDDDVLYQTYLSANKDLAKTSYKIPMDDGNYLVRMHFVENYWSAAAARLFDIHIEEQLRLSNLDIFEEVGYRTALVKDFEVSVTGGALNINFDPAVNRVAIAGLEIYKNSENVTSIPPELEAKKRQVLVFPNPGEGTDVQLVVKHFDSHEEMIVTLYDALGREILRNTFQTDSAGNITAPIAIAAFPAGIYILKVEAPSGEVQSKLLIK